MNSVWKDIGGHMPPELIHKMKRPRTIIPSASLVALGFVWQYLDKLIPWNTKPGLTWIQLIQWGLTALIIIVGLTAWIVAPLVWKEKGNLKEAFNYSILLHLLKLRGMNQIASALNIAKQMKEDADIVLGYLKKLHNDQFVTFQTGGLPPTLETDFFLSPKAFEILKI